MSTIDGCPEISKESDLIKFLMERPLVVVRFYSDTCIPCIKSLPDFLEVVKEYPKIQFATVNVKNVLFPKTISRIKYTPRYVIFKQHCGQIFSYTGTRLERLKNYLNCLEFKELSSQ